MDILMVDCNASGEMIEDMPGAKESSRSEGETCFGTVSILYWCEQG